LQYSPGSLGSENEALRTARDFARLVGRVINTTVSAAPITFVEVRGEEVGFIAHCERAIRPIPMLLANGEYLFVYQALGLRRAEHFLTTLEYRYTYQATAADDSWLVRYEYKREPPPPYAYPLCHLHVNANPTAYAGEKGFADLHLPCGERVTIESVCRHLVTEHGIGPLSPDWEEVLAGCEDAFQEIQKRRVLMPEEGC
jgi:hypothetical protein